MKKLLISTAVLLSFAEPALASTEPSAPPEHRTFLLAETGAPPVVPVPEEEGKKQSGAGESGAAGGNQQPADVQLSDENKGKGPPEYDPAEFKEADEPESGRTDVEGESRRGHEGRSIRSEASDDISPLPSQADAAVSRDRELEEKRIGEELQRWADRVKAVKQQGLEQGNTEAAEIADDLEDEYMVLELQWKKLQQLDTEEDWNQERANFEAAYNRFEEAWKDKVEEIHEG